MTSISSKKRTKTCCTVVKTNSFVRFLKEFMAWQFAFEINWPLGLAMRIFSSLRWYHLICDQQIVLTVLARTEIVAILVHCQPSYNTAHTEWPSDPMLLANVTLCSGMYPAGKVDISRHLAIPGFCQFIIWVYPLGIDYSDKDKNLHTFVVLLFWQKLVGQLLCPPASYAPENLWIFWDLWCFSK